MSGLGLGEAVVGGDGQLAGVVGAEPVEGLAIGGERRPPRGPEGRNPNSFLASMMRFAARLAVAQVSCMSAPRRVRNGASDFMGSNSSASWPFLSRMARSSFTMSNPRSNKVFTWPCR